MNFVLAKQNSIKIDNKSDQIAKVIQLTSQLYVLIGDFSHIFIYNTKNNTCVKKQLKHNYQDAKRLSDTHFVGIVEERDYDKVLVYDTVKDVTTEVKKFESKNKQRARIQLSETDDYIFRFIHKQGNVTTVSFFIGSENELNFKATLKIDNTLGFFMPFNDKFSYATSQSAAIDGKITINVYDGLTNVNKQINYENIVPKGALIQFIKELKNKNIILGFNCSREKDSTLMAIWELYNENNVKIHRFYQGEFNVYKVMFVNEQLALIGYFEHHTKQSKTNKAKYKQNHLPQKLWNFPIVNYRTPFDQNNTKKKAVQNFIQFHNPGDVYQNRKFIDFKAQKDNGNFNQLILRPRIIVDKTSLLVHLALRSGIEARFGQKIVDEAVKLII